MDIPSHEGNDNSQGIPEEVAERPQEEEAPELVPFYISFAKYNKKECQMDGLNKKRAKKALVALRDIGINLFVFDEFMAKLPKLELKYISNAGDYRKLYKGLGDIPDIEVYEIKIRNEDIRIFFFVIKKVFYIVAIRESHYDTTRGKRSGRLAW